MTVAGREPLTRVETRIRPLTNSNGMEFVAVGSADSAGAAMAPLTLQTARHVNIASHRQRSDVNLAMTRSLGESTAVVTWNARATGFEPIRQGAKTMTKDGSRILDRPAASIVNG